MPSHGAYKSLLNFIQAPVTSGLKDEDTSRERTVRGLGGIEYFVQKEQHIQRQQSMLKEQKGGAVGWVSRQ